MSIGLQSLDYLALSVFVACWIGTDRLVAHHGARHPSVHDLIRPVRVAWMRQVQQREIRIADAGLIGHLIHSATFFSSTTALIIGGLLALLGSTWKNAEAVRNLPSAIADAPEVLEIKMLVALGVFVIAFFRFTWSLRQFNLVTIYIGAMPGAAGGGSEARSGVAIAGRLMGLAGDNFIKGLRTYYFAVPVISWFMNGWLFMAASVAVAGVIYWMDFHSKTLEAMRESETPEE